MPKLKHRSFWLQEAVLEEPSLPLQEKKRADVVIVGGGYVGLWTALRLKEKSPAVKISVLEADICGGGASGRNGGFVLSWWPKINSLIQVCGEFLALKVVEDSVSMIDEIRLFSEEHQMDIHFRKSGWLWTATTEAQRDAWNSVLETSERLRRSPFHRISEKEMGKRSGSSVHRGGLWDTTAAMIQPAHLARGLRKVALQKGVEIYENTPVLSFTRRDPILVKTKRGEIQTERLIIATNAWAASLPELSRFIVPITSDMIVSAPARDELSEVGWVNGEGITDSQMMVDYYHVTKDFRVAFGKGGWGIAYGGNLGADFDRNEKRAKMVEADFRRYYPTLKNVPITHDWSGPIDRTVNSLPLLGRFKENPNILYGVGWSGNGVGPSGIGGKILSSLALDLKDEWSEYPLLNKISGTFPREPFRYVGAHVVRSAVAKKESDEMEGKKPSALCTWLSKLAPKGLEDKEV